MPVVRSGAATLHIDSKESVKVATTANITLSGAQTIDGVSAAVFDRVLVKDQTTASENGIYVVTASAWSRSADFAKGERAAGATVFVEEGSANADKGFVCTNDSGSDVTGTDDLAFSAYTGGLSVGGSVGHIQRNDGAGGLEGNGNLKWKDDEGLTAIAAIVAASKQAASLTSSASNASHDAGGLKITCTNTAAGPATPITTVVNTGVTSALVTMASHSLGTSGTAAKYLGGAFTFNVESAGGSQVQAAAIKSQLTTETAASEISETRLEVIEAGTVITGAVAAGKNFGVGNFIIANPPTTTLHVKGSLSHTTTAVSGAHAVAHTDVVLAVDTSSSAITVTLPAAAGYPGRMLTIADTTGDAITNNITISMSGSDTLNGLVGGGLIEVEWGVLKVQATGSFAWTVVGGTL